MQHAAPLLPIRGRCIHVVAMGNLVDVVTMVDVVVVVDVEGMVRCLAAREKPIW